MSRRVMLVLVALSVLVVAAGLSFLHIRSMVIADQQEKAFQSYAADNVFEVGIGETLVLDSRQDLEGADVGYTALFHWDGRFDATLLSVDYYSSLEEAGLDPSRGLAIDLDEGDHVLVCRMELHNVDAVRQGGGRFDWGVFKLVLGRRLDHQEAPQNGSLIYFDGTSPDVDQDANYYTFDLAQGEERVFTAAYVVRAGFENYRTYFSVGTTMNDKYLIDIHDGIEGTEQ